MGRGRERKCVCETDRERARGYFWREVLGRPARCQHLLPRDNVRERERARERGRAREREGERASAKERGRGRAEGEKDIAREGERQK